MLDPQQLYMTEKGENGYSITPEATRTLSLLDIILFVITHIPCFIVLHFTALHRYYVFFSYQLKVCGNPATKQVTRHHFSNSTGSLHVSVSHFGNSHNILDIFIMVSCYGNLWSVVFSLHYRNIPGVRACHELCP